MVTKMITLKLDSKFLKEIDRHVKKEGYQNRTELIRDALRKRMEEEKLQENLRLLKGIKGSSTKRVTDEEYERVREEVFHEIGRELKRNPLASSRNKYLSKP